MEVHRGKCRYVVIVGPLVFKFAIIYLDRLYDRIKKALNRKTLDSVSWENLSMFVFRGVIENINETRCYYQTRSRLLAKLLLPLLVVNIYRREKEVAKENFICLNITKEEEQASPAFFAALDWCNHTTSHPENFAFPDGKVKILDYGESGFLKLVRGHEAELEHFLLTRVKETKGGQP